MLDSVPEEHHTNEANKIIQGTFYCTYYIGWYIETGEAEPGCPAPQQQISRPQLHQLLTAQLLYTVSDGR